MSLPRLSLPKFSGFHLHKIDWNWEKYQPLYTPLAVVIAGLMIALAVYASGSPRPSSTGGSTPGTPQPGGSQTGGKVDVSVDDDAFLGNKDAKVTLIEFVDYECPFCKRHFEQVHFKLIEEYVNKGLARIVMRDFPLDFHRPAALKEAIAAECAREQGGDKTYFSYHDEIFTRTVSNGQGVPEAGYAEAAQKLGLDVSKFNGCLTSEKYKDEVLKDFDDGQKVQVGGTPTFFVNGTPLVGAQPFEAFKAAIDAELAK